MFSAFPKSECVFNPRTPRGVRLYKQGAEMAGHSNFNPRTPRGVRQWLESYQKKAVNISIHAPREGCDHQGLRIPPISQYFNPRTPRGVRQNDSYKHRHGGGFQSTHPARGATAPPQGRLKSPNFNPRTPRGVRHIEAQSGFYPMQFQSTHPARGATTPVSIPTTTPRHFNPRTPRGVRLHHCRAVLPTCRFQSTHPARGATAQ